MPLTISAEQIDLPGGAQLSLLEAGPADGQPLVLLHGIPTSAELWRGIMPKLAAEGFRCLAPNLPGYGMTRLSPDGDYSIFGAACLSISGSTQAASKMFGWLGMIGAEQWRRFSQLVIPIGSVG